MSNEFDSSEDTPATKQIHQWIDETLNGREKDTHVNRASSAPQCVRKRWYKAKGYESEKLQPRMILVFGLGDLVEHWVKNLIELACVGEGKLYSEVDFGKKTGKKFIVQHREFDTYEQEKLTITLPGLEVSGSPDGWGKRNADGKWELIEIKSSASYGYDEFAKGETPDYIRQVHALMLSSKAKDLGVRSARFFYMNKNTSHICDRSYDFDEEIAKTVEREYLSAAAEKIPDRPFGLIEETYYKKPTGRQVLGYPCTYCEFKTQCFPEVQMEVNKSGKPVRFIKAKKEGTNG